MGYTRHHAIVVTSFDASEVDRAKRFADSLGLYTTDSRPAHNSYISFLVVPDGGKEGAALSNAGNAARDAFVHYLRTSKESRTIDWVEVQFGDEHGEHCITRDSSRRSEIADRLMGGPARGSR